jgi:pSer/pThr/pTyr-binding forkhead associated (FHA) protein
MRQAELYVVSGRQAGTVIPLQEGKFLIGREEDCHLRPNSDLISRHHCVFTVDDFTVRLRDLGSTNGTLVNGERIRGGVVLNSGDVVSVGKIELRVVVKDPASDTSSSIAVNHDTSVFTPSVPAPASSPNLPVAPQNETSVDTGGSSFEIPAASETVADMPQVQNPYAGTPAGDTQFAFPGSIPMAPQGMPQQGMPQGMQGTLGYPQMAYPQMMPYGYPGYPPQMYGQPMGYPQMPAGYPQQAYQMPQQVEQPPAAAPAPSAESMAVKLPDPAETGAKAPAPKPAPPAGGETKSADAKNKEEAPKRAEDIIQQYLKRRPTAGGDKK